MPLTPTVVEQPPPPPLTRGNSVVSLYQSCLNLIERLSGVPGFEEYLNPDLLQNTQAGAPSTSSPNDPVHQLWVLFRMGSPLACIFNGLRPKDPLKINPATNLSNINACKASVFHFLVACRQELHFSENDLFSITDLFHDDTNGFVKVIKAVSMVLDRMEDQGLLRARLTTKRNSDQAKPTDNRAKVVQEILETERSYVRDLEDLQTYMRALQTDGTIISPETIHLIFANLNALVDFQRRFLIAVETHAAFAPQDQNFGQVFLQHEEAFAVYEPFCANFNEASKLILSEAPKLQKLAHLMEPIYGITSQLIKPVQRICKYPLFMHELIKLTDPEFPHYRDLVEGQASIKRVADRINETNRKQDNHLIAQALQHKVAWKEGELVSDFGTLLLHDKLLNPRSASDKELEVYLFEKIILFCQEIVSKKKQTKPLPKGAKPKPTLHLNGRIYINNIKSILPVTVSGAYVLHLVWNVAADEFELRCRNEDQLKKWHSVLDKLVTEANAQKTNIVSTTAFVGMPYVTPEQSSFYRDDDDYLDDDLDGDEEDYEDQRGYRSNSLPFGLAPQPAMLGSRPRAKTEDGTVQPVGSWNSRTGGYTSHAAANGRPSPGMSLPPMPRTSSSASTTMGLMSPGEYPYSPPSSYPASPTVSNSRGSTSSSSSWQRRSNGEGHSPMTETMSRFMSHDGSDDYTPGQPLSRNASTGYSYSTSGSAPPPVPQIPGQLRVRAQSSPNIHAAANPSWHNAPEVPTPLAHHRRPSNSSGPNSPTTPYPGSSFNIPAVPTIPSRHSSPRPDPSRTLRQQPSNSNLSAGVPQLKIKVNFQDDAYLIVVPIQIGYNELVERVEKKIRLCGCRRPDSQPLRLRYKDEDNDYIIMKDDDDISLAFESCYAEGVMNLHVS
ncbi:hypothetical protein BX616_000701 [Lobosporangium transversale]|uniref:Uncharacterized protein n=1 Tax=Lobosporangium transversale TaxID=64571 RepID=A0A1Y2GL00_9FUNG|nr:hypothetical protein BCR41DRAFT_371820 [Lobosporangium transversale]KAF9906534.1 hypothetical protein BX616_000701 [Lobosporangium transversale]ORZ12553.1 hypothetical protein BCR41DRAFT_371820 [Lobosporangium transversale]|eukprot:XP_021880172.1 hypothetical protein BCR41DRAFT_371820 [Lobosporangium transversale]